MQAQSTDRQQIEALYHQMYKAMIAKDTATLDRLHDDTFVLRHMTGMTQSKTQYISAIADGTLNYYAADTDSLAIEVTGDHAVMTGRSRVTAAVFGGGRHTWPLQLRFGLIRRPEGWRMTEARASTY